MAIAFDFVSQNQTNSNTSLSTAHTCSGNDRLLLVHILTNNTSDIIVGVTYNSVAMTQVDKVQNANSFYSYLYYLLNPSSGTANITSTFSLASLIANQGVSYTGVLQSGFPDATAKGSANSGTSLNATLTTVKANCWQFAGIRNDNAMTISPGTSRDATPFSGIINVADLGPIASPGSSTITATATIANANYITASFAPAPAASGMQII